MLTFESYKKRMETGLSFIEFNYQLLQSFDFLKLHERHNCLLQIGGDDQWGNIVAGVDLIRRKTGDVVYGLTFPLVTTSDGKKMGKTEKGALFLDPAQTPVYDFFQYWRNVTDLDVRKFFLLFTFLPVAEIDALVSGDINAAKERLAYEITAAIHGTIEADKALAGAKAAFGGGGNRDAMPTVEVPAASFAGDGMPLIDLLFEAKLAATKSDARRLVQQGGAYTVAKDGDETQILDVGFKVTAADFDEAGEIVLRAGKKKFCRIICR
jgi:tyrosyl-tRNA synthetase